MNNKYIFYDLETNGLDYYTTGILQITLCDIDSNIILNEYVYPYNNKIEGTEIHGITIETLKNNNAITTEELLNKLLELLVNDTFYLIAYNNFGYDQIILENNFKMYNKSIPENWYFSDLYPVVKQLYPKIKPNYKLATVYNYFYNNENGVRFHSSLDDTKCLVNIYKHINNTEIIDKYTRCSLHNKKILSYSIDKLNGYTSNINNKITINDLYNIYCNLNVNDKKDIEYKYENELKYALRIYNIMFIKSSFKQIEAINYFSKENSI